MQDSTGYVLVPLGHGLFAKVDEADAERVCGLSWVFIPPYAGRTITRNGKRTTQRLHQFILEAGKGLVVDHINRDKLDSRRSNLRAVTHAQNLRNQIVGRGVSDCLGVSWDDERKKWAAKITIDGVSRYLGRYKTEAEAAEAFKSASLFYFAGFAPVDPEKVQPKSYQELRNALKRPVKSTHKYVCFKANRWQAGWRVGGKTVHIGCFRTEEEALAAQRAFVEALP